MSLYKKVCTKPHCFFCIMEEQDPSVRHAGLANCFREIPLQDNQEHVLVLCSLWNIAMSHPDDPEFPSVGIFLCMANLISRSIVDRHWLLRYQNIYIPYYAAHVIGSYTMNRSMFAEKAVKSGVVQPLMGLFRGTLSWVEQRVAVRALGHLASYDMTFDAVAAYEEELVGLTMHIASTCLETVYAEFVGVKDVNKRPTYHVDLLTRGVGGCEMENRKVEEWASQLQCWSLYLLNCFATKGRGLRLICQPEFLKKLTGMWGGLVSRSSPGGVGLIRILCYSKKGRQGVAETREVVQSLCNLSRSSGDWQYMGIDCLVLLLKDPDTRYNVIEIAASFLVDLVELRNLGDRSNVGETIGRTLLLDYCKSGICKLVLKLKNKMVEKVLDEVWDLKVERRKREEAMSNEKVVSRSVLAGLVKEEGNQMVLSGRVEEAVVKYSKALQLCPLRMRKERMVIYSNRAQCHLLLMDAAAAIRDATRALCLSSPVNSHSKSLWRRSQAYDMIGLARESLMDCISYINYFSRSRVECKKQPRDRYMKIPYYAASMIGKQMGMTWLFSAAQANNNDWVDENGRAEHSDGCKQHWADRLMGIKMENKGLRFGLTTITEEPLVGKNWTESDRES